MNTITHVYRKDNTNTTYLYSDYHIDDDAGTADDEYRTKPKLVENIIVYHPQKCIVCENDADIYWSCYICRKGLCCECMHKIGETQSNKYYEPKRGCDSCNGCTSIYEEYCDQCKRLCYDKEFPPIGKEESNIRHKCNHSGKCVCYPRALKYGLKKYNLSDFNLHVHKHYGSIVYCNECFDPSIAIYDSKCLNFMNSGL